jgi:hypothetical protein
VTQAICPSCGTPNPGGFRFCGACGATGRADEAEGFRARGTAILRPIVDSVPDDLRAGFAAKPAVQELLAVP